MTARDATIKIEREPTQQEREGMAWFNSLSAAERTLWANRAAVAFKNPSAADCYTVYRTWPLVSSDDQKILTEQSAHERRVVEERDPFNVAVTCCAGIEVKMLAGMARDAEANGDRPMLAWYRDQAGVVQGVTFLTHLSPETVTLIQQDRWSGR